MGRLLKPPMACWLSLRRAVSARGHGCPGSGLPLPCRQPQERVLLGPARTTLVQRAWARTTSLKSLPWAWPELPPRKPAQPRAGAVPVTPAPPGPGPTARGPRQGQPRVPGPPAAAGSEPGTGSVREAQGVRRFAHSRRTVEAQSAQGCKDPGRPFSGALRDVLCPVARRQHHLAWGGSPLGGEPGARGGGRPATYCPGRGLQRGLCPTGSVVPNATGQTSEPETQEEKSRKELAGKEEMQCAGLVFSEAGLS